jgi:hypothetical protein
MNLLVLFVVSVVTLGLEILLTRVFSVALFASHSFLAISLALLGTGSGALVVYFAKPMDREKLQRRMIPLLALLSLTLIVSLWGLLQIEFVPQKIEDPRGPQVVQDTLLFRQRVLKLERSPHLFNSWRLYGAIPLAFGKQGGKRRKQTSTYRIRRNRSTRLNIYCKWNSILEQGNRLGRRIQG